MNDSIFLILKRRVDPYENGGRHRIYENVESNGIVKWSYIENFGPTRAQLQPNSGDAADRLFMPPVIQSIESGKFFFFPQETEANNEININIFNPIELWTKNKTLTRSPFEFPKSLLPRTSYWAMFILQI